MIACGTRSSPLRQARPAAVRAGVGWRVVFAALGLSIALGACSSPAVDARIEALGEEVPGVEPSEYHRAGQPCVLCHSTYEGASPAISVGGTIYAVKAAREEDLIPIENARVRITDSFGETREALTNCVGNFFLTKEDWSPAFPLSAEIEFTTPGSPGDAAKRVVMNTRISRDGSCAGCHSGPTSPTTPGWVFCAGSQPATPFLKPASCPVPP